MNPRNRISDMAIDRVFSSIRHDSELIVEIDFGQIVAFWFQISPKHKWWYLRADSVPRHHFVGPYESERYRRQWSRYSKIKVSEFNSIRPSGEFYEWFGKYTAKHEKKRESA